MKNALVLIGLIFILASCSSVSKQTKEDLAKPINCATAEGDIRALKAEKENVGKEIAAGIASIVPISLVLNTVSGNEGTNVKVATGEYNVMIDNKISEIIAQCNLEQATPSK